MCRITIGNNAAAKGKFGLAQITFGAFLDKVKLRK